jgi:pimeloyl-ACP methyl ester carboxylesterase
MTLHDASNDAYCLVGYSLGSTIAVRIALDYPDEVRALVGVVPWNAAGTTAGDEVIAGFDAAYGNVEALTEAVAAISLTRRRPRVYEQHADRHRTDVARLAGRRCADQPGRRAV